MFFVFMLHISIVLGETEGPTSSFSINVHYVLSGISLRLLAQEVGLIERSKIFVMSSA